MRYKIEIIESVEDDLKNVKVYYKQIIFDQILEQLSYEPDKETKHRKKLEGIILPWTTVEPVWQLSVDPYRIFYDIDNKNYIVWVRAIRHKPHGKRTEEIL